MMARVAVMLAVVGGFAGARAQTHVVKKPETVVRAVAVYEWTGEEGKPTASRVVPVSVFINGHLEDGGIYMARPVPFALDSGTVFEVEKAGAPEGTVVLAYSRHYVSNGASEAGNGANASSSADDGWLAYGAFKAAAKPVLVAAKKSGPLPQVVASGGKGPHFSNTPASTPDAGSGAGATPADKPVDRSGAAGGGTSVSAQNDPDQPTMKRRDSSADDGKSSSKPGSGASDSDDDVDRPTLKRRTPAEQKAQQKKKETASVTGSGSLNDDPDRPNLHRGKPATRLDEEDLPPLKGLPKDMHQMVAVSDAKDRPEHEFSRLWESDDEKAEVMRQMEALARAKLAGYDVAAAAPTSVAPAGGMAPAPVKSSAGKTVARSNMRGRVNSPPVVPVPVALADETLNAYTLSYGGAATYVYSAASAGVGGTQRYVSVVAQREPLGSLKVALTNVTDSTHLDRTPWMRLVDVVDAEASNRASLLFELRGQSSRQFGLYRVIGAEAEQTFVTATPE